MKTEAINCMKCKNYMVTWDSRFPKGCRLFGFKGTAMPSLTVYQSTGAPCQHFQERSSKQPSV